MKSSLFLAFSETLPLGPSPLATETATLPPVVLKISATSVWVNPGQSNIE